jgi:hypothetical protein
MAYVEHLAGRVRELSAPLAAVEERQDVRRARLQTTNALAYAATMEPPLHCNLDVACQAASTSRDLDPIGAGAPPFANVSLRLG